MTTWTAPDVASLRGDNSRPLQKIFGSLTEYLKHFETTIIDEVISQSSETFVRNGESTTLTIGTVVYLDAQQGDRATVKRAFNTSDATSAKTLGVVAESIAPNADGLVTTLGYVYKCNTGGYTAGQTLYLGSTAGTFTATKPVAPNHMVYVGVVVRANAGNGIIYVRCQNGYELDEIHDVLITSPTTGDILMRNGSSLWINTPQTSITSVGTLTAGTVPATLLSGTVASARISGSYTGITGLGTVTVGDISSTLLSGTIASARLSGSYTGITGVGTLTAGTWNGSLVAGQYGGTGVANTGKTITIGGNFTTSGAFTTTLTVTANTSVTLPTSGTLATTDASSLTSGLLASARLSGSYTGITSIGTLSTLTVDGASSAAFTLGDWGPNGNYGGVIGNKGYLLIGNNSSDAIMYLRTSSAGTVNIGANGANTLIVGDGSSTATNIAGLLTKGNIWNTSTATTTLTGFQYVVRSTSIYPAYYHFTSMREGKRNIQTFTDSGVLIDQLNPVTYQAKIDETDDEVTSAWKDADLEYGFIAEEVAEVGTGFLAQYEDDGEGNLKPAGWKFHGVVSVLVAEVKDLRSRLKALEGAK